VSVSLSVTRLRPAEAAARIEVLFGVETSRGQKNIVLDGGFNFRHGFDAAFAKLLWLFVFHVFSTTFVSFWDRRLW